MKNINILQVPTECLSNPVVPPEYQPWYDYMAQFLTLPIFDLPAKYRKMAFGLHLITASSGIQFWDVPNSNDIPSDAPVYFTFDTHRLMIDMIKETGADFVQIRTRYPDNNFVPGSEEALKGAIQYAKSKGLGIYLMFIPEGPEHLHVTYGDTVAFMQKFQDFVNEYISIYTPQFFQMYGSGQIQRSMGIDADSLIPDFYGAIKAASPNTQYVEAEGANKASQVLRFKYFVDSPYNDLMGIPLHDLYNKTFLKNLRDMVIYAKSKNRTLICPDAWLTDAHFDNPWELFFNDGWREPLDRDYMAKVVNIAQTAGFDAISTFYGNTFTSYNPSFFYPITDMNPGIWVNCLRNGSRTSLPQAYKAIIDTVRSSSLHPPGRSFVLPVTIGILSALIIAGVLLKK